MSAGFWTVYCLLKLGEQTTVLQKEFSNEVSAENAVRAFLDALSQEEVQVFCIRPNGSML